MIRFYLLSTMDDREEMEKMLDDELLDYDYDSGGRLMVNEEDYEDVVEVLDACGIMYREI